MTLAEAIKKLEAGEHVNGHDNKLPEKARNIIVHFNRNMARQRARMIARLKEIEQ
jgi:hypothetical protein